MNFFHLTKCVTLNVLHHIDELKRIQNLKFIGKCINLSIQFLAKWFDLENWVKPSFLLLQLDFFFEL